MTEAEGPLINSNAVRARLGGVSAMTLHRWIARGILPAPVYINGRRYWRTADIAKIATRGAGAQAGAA